jgi:hypothetical protein
LITILVYFNLFVILSHLIVILHRNYIWIMIILVLASLTQLQAVIPWLIAAYFNFKTFHHWNYHLIYLIDFLANNFLMSIFLVLSLIKRKYFSRLGLQPHILCWFLTVSILFQAFSPIISFQNLSIFTFLLLLSF